ncbi:MAG: carboxylesterase family protein, partial [Sphingorhabdus sp.]
MAMVPTHAAKVQSNLRILKGIRYGVAERFAAPIAVPFVAPSGGAFASFGPACPQPGNRYLPTSEDCLFLNLWAPTAKAKQPRPVMVYFHGGAYSTGSVTDPINDGAALAS